MLKKLTQIGSSWGLIIPKATLALLNINPLLDKVVITTTEDSIVIKKYKK